MAKQNKKGTPTPEGLNFMDLIRKVGNDTLALFNCEPNWRSTQTKPQRDLHKRGQP